MNVICDLDGTLALDHARAKLHLNLDDGNGGKFHRWKEYFDLCHEDQPQEDLIDLMNHLSTLGYTIFIMTGRSQSVETKTRAWLQENEVPFDYLIMRPENDRTDDHFLKLNWARKRGLLPENTPFVFEDRQRVVDAWRAAGFTCLQVAPGNF